MDDIERLVAIEEIRTLQARYVRLADARDWAGLSALFLPHAPFTALNVAGEETAVMNGPEEIAAGVATGVGDGVVIHHLFSHEIEIGSPRSAHAVWSMEDWIDRTEDRTVDPADMPFRTMRGYGHYHIDYVKPDREWRIARLTLSRVRIDIDSADEIRR